MFEFLPSDINITPETVSKIINNTQLEQRNLLLEKKISEIKTSEIITEEDLKESLEKIKTNLLFNRIKDFRKMNYRGTIEYWRDPLIKKILIWSDHVEEELKEVSKIDNLLVLSTKIEKIFGDEKIIKELENSKIKSVIRTETNTLYFTKEIQDIVLSHNNIDYSFGDFLVVVAFNLLDNRIGIIASTLRNNKCSHIRRDSYHPHILNEVICTGNNEHNRRKIEERIRKLDIPEAFDILESILRTYNQNSPYVYIETWGDNCCSICGNYSAANLVVFGEQKVCPNCISKCQGCGTLILRDDLVNIIHSTETNKWEHVCNDCIEKKEFIKCPNCIDNIKTYHEEQFHDRYINELTHYAQAIIPGKILSTMNYSRITKKAYCSIGCKTAAIRNFNRLNK